MPIYRHGNVMLTFLYSTVIIICECIIYWLIGHVLGAAMFMIEIAGVKVLYTGDFSREEDRHLMAAEIPAVKPDVLIMVKFCDFTKLCYTIYNPIY